MTPLRTAPCFLLIALLLSACTNSNDSRFQRIVIAQPTELLTVGDTSTLTVTAYDEEGDPVFPVVFRWSSSDSSVVEVAPASMFSAVVTARAAGVATVTVRSGGKSDSAHFTVSAPAPASAPAAASAASASVRRLVRVSPPPSQPGGASAGNVTLSIARERTLDDQRSAVLLDGGRLLVRDEATGASITVADAGAADFQLDGPRVAMLDEGGSLQVKDDLDQPFTEVIAGDVAGFELEAGRIGVLRADGALLTKRALDEPWTVLVESGAVDFDLSGDRTAVLLEGGELRAQDATDGAWHTLATGVSGFQLQE